MECVYECLPQSFTGRYILPTVTWMDVYSSPSLAVLFPVCCQITLDFLWLQKKLLGITLHQSIVRTDKTEKSKVNIHFKSMKYFKAVKQMLYHVKLSKIFPIANSKKNGFITQWLRLEYGFISIACDVY